MCSSWNEANGLMKRTATGLFVLALLLSVLALTCTGCDSLTKSEAEDILSQIDALTGDTDPTPAPPITESLDTGTETDAVDTTPPAPTDTPAEPAVFRDEYYYDLTHVVLYIDTYDCLPENSSPNRKQEHSAGQAAPWRFTKRVLPSAGTRSAITRDFCPRGSPIQNAIWTPMARTAVVPVGSYSAKRMENTVTTARKITTAVFLKYISTQTGRLHTDEGIHRRL